MEQVIKILMDRADMSEEDARALAEETLEEMLESLDEGDTEAAQEIFEDNLGLEPDYIPAFILGGRSSL